MQHLDFFIIDMAFITLACAVVTLIFKKIKLPVVLGYIVAGFLISPNFVYLPTVVKASNIEAWANIGIVFLMFALGLEFSFKKIAGVGVSAIVTALTVMAAMIVIGTITGRLLGFGRIDSMFLGGMLSISSTMIILKAYEEYDLMKEKFASLIMGTMVVEDVGGIFMMVILSTVAVSKNVSGIGLTLQMGKLVLFLVIWLALGIYLIPTLLRKTSRLLNDELLLIVSLAICFGMVVISHRIGFSEALGAFMGGSILAGTVKGERIDKLITPLKDLFGAIFFVSVGMMVVPSMLIEYIKPIIIITIVTIVGQSIFATLGILFSGRTLRTAVRGGLSMVQVGEFSFIIASLGTSLKVTGDYLYPVIVCVSVITIFTTPLFIKNSEKAYRWLDRILPDRLKNFLDRYTADSAAAKDTDNDWKRFLKKYFIRTLICGSMMFAIYFFSTRYAAPLAGRYVPGLAGKIIVLVISCVVMLIPLILMIHKRKYIYLKLWIKSTVNRLPLIILRAGQELTGAMFFALLFRHYLHLPWWLLIIASLAVIFVVTRIDFLKSQAIRIEARFIANVNEKLLHARKEASGNRKWFGDRIYVAEFVLDNPYDIPDISEVYDDKYFDMRVIKLVRGDMHINIPKGDQPVKPGDIIQMVGTKDELDAYLMLLEHDENIRTPEQPLVTMKEYLYGQIFREVKAEDQIIYAAVPVEKDSPFAKKQVKKCGFREKYLGFIIGIERHNYPIVDPTLETVIHEGDTLWIIGTEETAERLVKDNLLQADD